MSFKKATKLQSKLRLALIGLAGSGKSYSSLSIGHAIGKLMRERGLGEGRIAVIDSERGSASLYADRFEFDVAELDSYSPLSYVEKIHEAEAAGYDIIIADSISHAWAGKDGALDQKDKVADRGGNSWTAWRDVTPKHNALVDAMVGCRAHFIATMRTKVEYAQETINGKVEIKKLGLAAIQRDGLDYEFSVVGDIGLDHTLKISKSRCSAIEVGEQFEKPGEAFAKRLVDWLLSGFAPPPRVVESPPVVTSLPGGDTDAFAGYLHAMDAASTVVELDLAAVGPGKPDKGTPQYGQAAERYLAKKDQLERGVAA